MSTAYPIIANCNYESADDDTIHRIRKAVDGRLADDTDLDAALEVLEATLEKHSDSASVVSTEACEEAESGVRCAWRAVSDGIEETHYWSGSAWHSKD